MLLPTLEQQTQYDTPQTETLRLQARLTQSFHIPLFSSGHQEQGLLETTKLPMSLEAILQVLLLTLKEQQATLQGQQAIPKEQQHTLQLQGYLQVAHHSHLQYHTQAMFHIIQMFPIPRTTHTQPIIHLLQMCRSPQTLHTHLMCHTARLQTQLHLPTSQS